MTLDWEFLLQYTIVARIIQHPFLTIKKKPLALQVTSLFSPNVELILCWSCRRMFDLLLAPSCDAPSWPVCVTDVSFPDASFMMNLPAPG